MNKGFIAALLIVFIVCVAYIALANVFGRKKIDFNLCPMCERPVAISRDHPSLHPGTP
jgi:hypothetical protein